MLRGDTSIVQYCTYDAHSFAPRKFPTTAGSSPPYTCRRIFAVALTISESSHGHRFNEGSLEGLALGVGICLPRFSRARRHGQFRRHRYARATEPPSNLQLTHKFPVHRLFVAKYLYEHLRAKLFPLILVATFRDKRKYYSFPP